jgi:hypothetical protein
MSKYKVSKNLPKAHVLSEDEMLKCLNNLTDQDIAQLLKEVFV